MSESATFDSARRTDEDPILEVRNARVTFETDRGRAQVLDDVTIDINRGETLGVIGESGCGKSTFGTALLNAVRDPGVLTGEIIYHPKDGEPVDLLDLSSRKMKRIRWEEIALVTQAASNAFNPTISIRRHFTETFAAHDVDLEEGLERTRETLRDLGLDPDRVLGKTQDELSGGEKQRTQLALSLVFDPEILVLDEPTVGLDLLVQRELLSLLYDIKDEYDLTLVFISHNIPIISGFADRIAVMYAFDIIELGSARDILLSPDHPYTRMMSRSSLDLSMPTDVAEPIEGETPDPINVPSGCPFHPRCPIADDRCEVEEPERRSDDTGSQEVACFYPDVASDRIPVTVDETEDQS